MPISCIVKYTRPDEQPKNAGLISFETKECEGVHEGIVLVIPVSVNDANFFKTVNDHLEVQSQACQVIHIQQEDLNKALLLTPGESQTDDLAAILFPNTDEDVKLHSADLFQMAKRLFKDSEEKVTLGLLDRHVTQLDEPVANEAAALTGGASRLAKTKRGSVFGKFFQLPKSTSITSIEADASQGRYVSVVTAETLPGKKGLCRNCIIS